MKTTQVVNFPRGYLTTEDKVSMVLILSNQKILEKKEGTLTYSKKYNEVISALLISCRKDVETLDTILFEQ